MVIIKPVDESRIVTQQLPGFAPEGSGIKVSMLRLDLVHPLISGNKWYKLQQNIRFALQSAKAGIVSFGGAYSNHLVAVAAAARYAGMRAVGIVRGLQQEESKVLALCRAWGMELEFLTREEYGNRNEPSFIEALQLRYPDFLIIPEGGANDAGRTGAGRIAQFISPHFTHIMLSVGTGTTFTGLRNVLPVHQYLLGFVPMKGGSYLKDHLIPAMPEITEAYWGLTDEFHFGGFGKINEELIQFMSGFEAEYGFKLDRVYTAKMMAGLRHLVHRNVFSPGADILCIHTGGLTGN